MTDAILQHRERGLLILQLNRPEKKNALTRAMYTNWPRRSSRPMRMWISAAC